jgi:hypothetical protein
MSSNVAHVAALQVIKNIAEGTATALSLPQIARIASSALGAEPAAVDPRALLPEQNGGLPWYDALCNHAKCPAGSCLDRQNSTVREAEPQRDQSGRPPRRAATRRCPRRSHSDSAYPAICARAAGISSMTACRAPNSSSFSPLIVSSDESLTAYEARLIGTPGLFGCCLYPKLARQ